MSWNYRQKHLSFLEGNEYTVVSSFSIEVRTYACLTLLKSLLRFKMSVTLLYLLTQHNSMSRLTIYDAYFNPNPLTYILSTIVCLAFFLVIFLSKLLNPSLRFLMWLLSCSLALVWYRSSAFLLFILSCRSFFWFSVCKGTTTAK